MTGTLRTHSRTRARARAYWAAQLPLPCPHCGHPVLPWQRWDLDHAVPLALGGTDADVRPAHAHCNRAQGDRIARLAAARRSGRFGLARRRTWRPPAPFSHQETRDREW